jgi:uncharacterized protein
MSIHLSDNRIAALARQVLRMIATEGEVVNERAALTEVKRLLVENFQRDEIDEIVRRKIASLSRRVVPGSTEWDVLYRRYSEEEARKHKF